MDQAGTVDARRWFLLFAYSKYDEIEVEQLFEDAQMNAAIMEKIYNELYPLSARGKREIKEARDQGVQEGVQVGREEGQLTEARETLHRLVSRPFPSLSLST